MKRATVVKLVTENKLSYGIKVTPQDKDEFTIPVVDVRDGMAERGLVNYILKGSRSQKGSNFMRPSFGSGGNCYQVSQKKAQ